MERKMQLNPYLAFNGQCEEAFKFYEQCLGGKIAMMMRYGESPMAEQTPAAARNNIAHARLVLGDKVLMGSDRPPGREGATQGFHVSLGPDDPAEAERIFNALAEGGRVDMPIQQTFWAARFGMLVDRFGIPWMVNCEQPA
jgi:PhnB protein